jgi:WD40 repeat protein
MSTAVRLRCHTPAQQFGGKKGRGAGAVASIFIQADSLIVVYSDLKVGTYRWAPTGSASRLRPEKLRALPSRQLSHSRTVMKRGSAAPQTMDESASRLAVGHWSFAVTVGGYEKEQARRKSTLPSRLASAKDALYTDAAPLIVSCGYWDNAIKVHSTDSWKLESSESGGHRGPIRCLAIGSDGGLLVTGGEDCTCRVWVVDHPDMATAISDAYAQTLLGRRTRSDQILSCCHVLWGHDFPISCVDLSCALDVAVSGSVGGKICVHTLSQGELIRFFNPSSNINVAIDKICLECHGRMVIQTSDRMLYTYTINGVCLCSMDARERVHDMKITGEVLVTGGENCHVYIRNLTTLKVLSGLDLSRHGPIRTISLTPDDFNPIPQHLFIGSDDGMISIVQHD